MPKPLRVARLRSESRRVLNQIRCVDKLRPKKATGVLEQATILCEKKQSKKCWQTINKCIVTDSIWHRVPNTHLSQKPFGLWGQQLGYDCLSTLLAYVQFVSDGQLKLLHHLDGNCNQWFFFFFCAVTIIGLVLTVALIALCVFTSHCSILAIMAKKCVADLSVLAVDCANMEGYSLW